MVSRRLHPERKHGEDDTLWEESIVLINADSEEEARAKAERIGRGEQTSFQAISGERVKWEFVRVGDVHEILDTDLKDGTELFSRFVRGPDALT